MLLGSIASWSNVLVFYHVSGEGGLFFFSIAKVHFVFLLIEFHCTFSICYKILQYYVDHYFILTR